MQNSEITKIKINRYQDGSSISMFEVPQDLRPRQMDWTWPRTPEERRNELLIWLREKLQDYQISVECYFRHGGEDFLNWIKYNREVIIEIREKLKNGNN